MKHDFPGNCHRAIPTLQKWPGPRWLHRVILTNCREQYIQNLEKGKKWPKIFFEGSIILAAENLRWPFFIFFYLFIFICSEFCHTLEWNSHGFTCVLHPDPPSHLPLHPLPLGFPSAPGPSACLMHPTWAGWILYMFRCCSLEHPTLSFSHRV